MSSGLNRVIICLALLFLPSLTLAATDDFTIRAFVGDDVTAPTVPVLESVVPIASSQIDIAWSTSTDDWIFGGYVLWRDNLPIATTTLTSYSDTGLTPETLYAYTVYAFDEAGNISATSSTLSTTTLGVPVVATSTPPVDSPPSGTRVVTLKSFLLEEDKTFAWLTWETNMASRFSLRWGRTDAYTGGYIENETYLMGHRTKISDLEPGTVYQYELIGYTPTGIAVSLKKGDFTTLSQDINRVVPNVERLTAAVEGDDVVLNYIIPPTEVGARVRIVRSHLGYPTDLSDGAIIYEGAASTWRDPGALVNYEKQYYTVFLLGSDGSVSSGAVVVALKLGVVGIPGEPGKSVATSTEPGLNQPPEIILSRLTENNIIIKQGGKQFSFIDESISLSYSQPFTILIPKTALPEHLKSIIVTLLDPTDQRRSYTFLLRINKSGTAYEATISALDVVGVSRLQIEVYDFKQLVIGRYRKQIDFVREEKVEAEVVFPDLLIEPLKVTGVITLGLVGLGFIGWFLFIWRRRAEDKN